MKGGGSSSLVSRENHQASAPGGGSGPGGIGNIDAQPHPHPLDNDTLLDDALDVLLTVATASSTIPFNGGDPATGQNWVDSPALDHTYARIPLRQSFPSNTSQTSMNDSLLSPPRNQTKQQQLQPQLHQQQQQTSSSTRRSARQQEKSEKYVLEKIKAENQEMLRREREGGGVQTLSPSKSPSNVHPKKRKDENVDVKEEEEEEEGEEEMEDDEDEWGSDDDPDKLWCTCRQPHNNRFMIACDGCEEWFHGTCVGVTKKQGKIFEEQEKKWFCSTCRGRNDPHLNKLEGSGKKVAKSGMQTVKCAKAPTTPTGTVQQTPKRRKSSESKDAQQETGVSGKRGKAAAAAAAATIAKSTPTVLSGRRTKEKEKEKEDKLRLKRLIKNKKMEVKMKLKEEKKRNKEHEKEKLHIAVEQTRPVPAEPIGHLSHPPKPISKSEKKSKKGKEPVDLSLQDLFKAEPLTPINMTLHTPGSAKTPTPTTPSFPKRPSLDGNVASSVCITCSEKISDEELKGKKSIYCSSKCIEKHVRDLRPLINSKKGSDGGERRVVLQERSTGKCLAGGKAIPESKVETFLKSHPSHEILKPSASSSITTTTPTSIISPALVPQSPKAEGKKRRPSVPDSGMKEKRKRLDSCDIRISSRRLLEEALVAKGAEMDKAKKIAKEIEQALFNFFKGDTGIKYKTKQRSLIFNLRDTKNQLLFGKVISGEINGERLVRMTKDELASSELALWRERENAHNLELMKRDAELAAKESMQSMKVKKTHKGEVVIENQVVSSSDLPSAPLIPKHDVSDVGIEEDSADGSRDQESVESEHNGTSTTTPSSISLVQPTGTPLASIEDTSNSGENSSGVGGGDVISEGPKRVQVAFDEKTTKILEEASRLRKEDVLGSRKSNKSATIARKTGAPPWTNPLEWAGGVGLSPKVWKGIINMQEVSSFSATGFAGSSGTDWIAAEVNAMPESLQVCGRIAPEQVLDYLKKLKHGSRTEIMVIVLIGGQSGEERQGYDTFFTYLNSRKRYGVVGNAGRSWKDFYIMPLPRDANPPEVLNPLHKGLLSKDGTRKWNLLLAILVKNRKVSNLAGVTSEISHLRTRYTPSSISSLRSRDRKGSREMESEQPHASSSSTGNGGVEQRSYTPPPVTREDEASPCLGVEEEEEAYDPGISLTPPHPAPGGSGAGAGDNGKGEDEPYDPEEALNDPPTSLSSSSTALLPASSFRGILAESHSSSTSFSIPELLEKLSKSTNPGEMSTQIVSSISATQTVAEQKRILDELTQKVEESKLELRQRRLAAEATFSYSSTNKEKGDAFIPGLDGDFPSKGEPENVDDDEDGEEQTSADNQMSSILLPENLKEILEKVRSKDHVRTGEDGGEQKSGSMINEEDVKSSKSADPRLRSRKQKPLLGEDKKVTELGEDELRMKAELQMRALKEIETKEKHQGFLEEALKRSKGRLL